MISGGVLKEHAFKCVLITALAFVAIYISALMLSQAAFFRWSSFIHYLVSEEILFSIRLSLISATISSLLAVLFALPAAYALSKFEFFGKEILDTLIDLPIALSPIAVGTVILMFFHTRMGAFIETYGGRVLFSFKGILLAQFTIVSVLAIRLLKSTFDDIDPRYEAVARFLGSSRFRAFYKVTLPMARRGGLHPGEQDRNYDRRSDPPDRHKGRDLLRTWYT